MSSARAARFRDDGFVVVPGFLERDEVRALRVACRDVVRDGARIGGGRVVFDLAHNLPDVAKLLDDPRTVALARELIGDEVVHLHQNAVHAGPVNRGWHKDDYTDPRLATFEDYRIVHFCWYLQDHVAFGGATSVRRGSHRVASDRVGEIVPLEVRAGDLVAFDLRTTHFGNTLRLADGRPLFLDRLWRLRRPPWSLVARVQRALPRLFLPDHGDARLVIFAMYGADDTHTARFFRWLGTQPDLRHVLRYERPAAIATTQTP